MSGKSADEASLAVAAGYPAVRRQRSMMDRGFGPYASSSYARQQRPQIGPRLKRDDAAASEALQQHQHHQRSHNHNRHRHGVKQFQPDPMQPLASSRPVLELKPSNAPVLPPIRSPRWDSLQKNHTDLFYNPTSTSAPASPNNQGPQRTRAESTPLPRVAARSAFPGLSSNPFIPEAYEPEFSRSEAPQFSLFPRQNDMQQHQQPVTPASTASGHSSPAGSRQATPTEGKMGVGNFSRHRKPSVRSQQPDGPFLRHLPVDRPHPEAILERPTPNSVLEQPTFNSAQSIRQRPSNDHLSPVSRTASLRRANPANTPSSSSPARSALTYGNNSSSPAPSRENPPWVASDDELRSSFRSQLTTSTAQGTLFTASGTERSSVLTKTSSIPEEASINYGYNRASWRTNNTDDGPTVEDVMGMYEQGFADSDIEESIRMSRRFLDEEEDYDEMEDGHGMFGMDGSRPPSSHSDASALESKLLEAMDDQLPLPGGSRAYVARDSAGAMFRNSIASSLPKDIGFGLAADSFARRNELEKGLSKHDSAKLLDGDEDSVQRHGMGKASSPSSPLLQDGQMNISSRSATPSPAVQLPEENPEDPECRDRYGFKKANAYVNREQYDAWNASYSEYLARRRKKWVAFLKDHSLLTDNPNRFPLKSNKARRFVRKGIPPDWRGAAWFYYAGGPALLAKNRGVYADLVRRAGLDPKGAGGLPDSQSEVKELVIDDIEKDLHRTFPDNVRFKPPRTATPPTDSSSESPIFASDAPSAEDPSEKRSEPEIISSLRRVLRAFALMNPRIGYCQSLNFIAGMLLLFVETEEHAFWLLNVITRVYLPGTHEISLEGSKVDLAVLMIALKDSLPGIWRQIGGDEIDLANKKNKGKRGKEDMSSAAARAANDPNRLPTVTICMTSWFMSCFIGTLPTETVLRVWDVFFYEGSRTLFRIALTIFKLGEPEIKAMKDPVDIFSIVQAIPRRMLDCNVLLELCFRRRNGIGHLSQEMVEEKRQERRESLRRWHEATVAAASKATQDPEKISRASTAGLDLAADAAAITAVIGTVHRKGTLFGRRKDREQMRAAEVL
ncbi:hypothetical protein QBC46DRAFT_46917 [Diplogelasinospora grovesii]|uniref:Rab-GAP TBC domain-containing protein n=1 Tax=Diplogelasinospora grovesii TaxID=303347 RepID=A0AAN6MXZ3_9PEZI|nr:hypothetical protein QBC46DRAFT_46917 [Diplogelasinospora grovesii]